MFKIRSENTQMLQIMTADRLCSTQRETQHSTWTRLNDVKYADAKNN